MVRYFMPELWPAIMGTDVSATVLQETVLSCVTMGVLDPAVVLSAAFLSTAAYLLLKTVM